MPEAKLKFEGREFVMGGGVTTIGRTSDNFISFGTDANVSRYHAEIENRDGEYWLIDLGSSNGTTLNGRKVVGEAKLNEGDTVVFGGTSKLKIEITKDAATLPEDAYIEKEEEQIAEEAQVLGAPNRTLLVAGAAVGLAVVFAVGAGAFYFTRDTKCDALAVIVKPEPGDTISNPTEIEVDAENTGCVAQAVFTIDGIEIASTTGQPYTATLDPKDFPEFADGYDHNLQIVLIDKNGQKIVGGRPVLLAFETREIAKPLDEKEIAANLTQKKTSARQISLIETQELSKLLLRQFSGNFAYKISNRQFLLEVQKRTAEYAEGGYFERAAAFRDAINVAYVQEQNLDASLGFFLAMSRSKFAAARVGEEEGLWKMSPVFVTANAYNGLCGNENLSAASQNCAAKASALYMKAIVFGVFDGDVIYSVAAFGKSPQEAAVWKSSLPSDRSDIWNVIRTPQEREQIVKFFAAGIVAENPHKFGLKRDRPLSELYRVTM